MSVQITAVMPKKAAKKTDKKLNMEQLTKECRDVMDCATWEIHNRLTDNEFPENITYDFINELCHDLLGKFQTLQVNSTVSKDSFAKVACEVANLWKEKCHQESKISTLKCNSNGCTVQSCEQCDLCRKTQGMLYTELKNVISCHIMSLQRLHDAYIKSTTIWELVKAGHVKRVQERLAAAKSLFDNNLKQELDKLSEPLDDTSCVTAICLALAGLDVAKDQVSISVVQTVAGCSALVKYNIMDTVWSKAVDLLWLMRGFIVEISSDHHNVTTIVPPIVKFMEVEQYGVNQNWEKLVEVLDTRVKIFKGPKFDGTGILVYMNADEEIQICTLGDVNAAGMPDGNNTFREIVKNLLGSWRPEIGIVYQFELLHPWHETYKIDKPQLMLLAMKSVNAICPDEFPTKTDDMPFKVCDYLDAENDTIEDVVTNEGDCLWVSFDGIVMPFLKRKRDEFFLAQAVTHNRPITVGDLPLLAKSTTLSSGNVFPSSVSDFIANNDLVQLHCFLKQHSVPNTCPLPCLPNLLVCLTEIIQQMGDGVRIQLDIDNTLVLSEAKQTGKKTMIDKGVLNVISKMAHHCAYLVLCSGRSSDDTIYKDVSDGFVKLKKSVICAKYPGTRDEHNDFHKSPNHWKALVAAIICPSVVVDDNRHVLETVSNVVKTCDCWYSHRVEEEGKPSSLTWTIFSSTANDKTHRAANMRTSAMKKTVEFPQGIIDEANKHLMELFGNDLSKLKGQKHVVFGVGVPGVGKTTMIRAMMLLLKQADIDSCLASGDAHVEDENGDIDQSKSRRAAHFQRENILKNSKAFVIFYDSVCPSKAELKLATDKGGLVHVLDFMTALEGAEPETGLRRLTQIWRQRFWDFRGSVFLFLKQFYSAKNTWKTLHETHKFAKVVVIQPWMSGVDPTFGERCLLTLPDSVLITVQPPLGVVRTVAMFAVPVEQANGKYPEVHQTLKYFKDAPSKEDMQLHGSEGTMTFMDTLTLTVSASIKGKQYTTEVHAAHSMFVSQGTKIPGHVTLSGTGPNAPAAILSGAFRQFDEGKTVAECTYKGNTYTIAVSDNVPCQKQYSVKVGLLCEVVNGGEVRHKFVVYQRS